MRNKQNLVNIISNHFKPPFNQLMIKEIRHSIRLKPNSNTQIPNVVMKEEVYENEMLYSDGENEMTPNHHLLGLYHGIYHQYYQLELLKSKTKINKLSLGEIEEALKWKLLLQFDSDESLNLMFADAGKIYFFIHEDDLEKRDFNKVKIIGDTY